jgi:hypothetical protein
MFNIAFDAIDKGRIEALVANEARENLTLEYKETLPGSGRDDKKEFLADISAFANASGGDIVYGVREKREGGRATGIPDKAVGLANINADAEIRRLESLIIVGIEPRISGIRIKAIDGFESGSVILLRIPKSFLSPHMLKLGDSRFYSRTKAGKQPLDVMQIRSAFSISESLPEKVRRFRDERIARIVAGETPIPLPDRPKIVLHLLPAASLDPSTRVDFSVLTANHKLQEPINTWNGWIPRFNLDGFLVHSNAHQPSVPVTYLQAFRNGALEAVESQLISYGTTAASGSNGSKRQQGHA